MSIYIQSMIILRSDHFKVPSCLYAYMYTLYADAVPSLDRSIPEMVRIRMIRKQTRITLTFC
ncbi:hypothetical protein M378DRAFT_159508 [Amanita muscaria Koide BX008]|uniref:Uncharacterized protein n=1 Tax=Amanita muscaria (strain Koide BX008) TaxID=946122 RepID=A0A0C2SW48_AMAMK|nr:hypothetical protein M378DRAFT_159508 [Amanita muscaria Koide BX008]